MSSTPTPPHTAASASVGESRAARTAGHSPASAPTTTAPSTPSGSTTGGTVTVTGTPGELTVTDTGEGIPAEDLPHVFDRFRRVDASRTRATGSSGLGLAIVRQVVEAHGGTAAIASEPGRGTTVTLRLPR